MNFTSITKKLVFWFLKEKNVAVFSATLLRNVTCFLGKLQKTWNKKCQATVTPAFIRPCVWGIRIDVQRQTLGASFSAGPVYHEYCDCPEEDPEIWQNVMSCPSQEPQVTKDFVSFPTIDLQRMLKEIPAKFSGTRGAIVHYTILDNHVYRRSLGKYTDFKMFSDEMLLSLARKVSVLIIFQLFIKSRSNTAILHLLSYLQIYNSWSNIWLPSFHHDDGVS